MSARDIANRFREQRYTSTDTNSVVIALRNGDAGFLGDVVASYIKYADNVDERTLIQYLMVADDFLPASEIIAGLSNLRCTDKQFAEEVLRYARGVAWDPEGYAQLAAIAAIPRILSNDPRVQDVLRATIKSSNVVVRDVTLEAVQQLLGTPFSKIKRGLSDDNLLHSVSKEVREWLGIEPA